jgi:hypothetical protein
MWILLQPYLPAFWNHWHFCHHMQPTTVPVVLELIRNLYFSELYWSNSQGSLQNGISFKHHLGCYQLRRQNSSALAGSIEQKGWLRFKWLYVLHKLDLFSDHWYSSGPPNPPCLP